MKLLFIILRMFGHMPYHVTSKGKLCCPVKFIRFDKSIWIIFSSYLCAVLFSPLKEIPSMENVWISLQATSLQALTFCSYKGFKLVDTLNCWPERHSIIGRKKEASSMETYFHILSKGSRKDLYWTWPWAVSISLLPYKLFIFMVCPISFLAFQVSVLQEACLQKFYRPHHNKN